MAELFTMAPEGFCWATGIEDTFVPQARPGLRGLDEYELTQHYTLWKSDVDLVAASGVRAVRWGIPWYKVQPTPHTWDWSWTDQVLDYLVNVKGILPILDLMHYGTPLWLEDSFADARYPELVAQYAQAVAARYKSLVRYYTPLNEPTINAQMCGRAGEWPPYLTGDSGYVRVLQALARGIVLTSRALRAEQPEARLVQVEALWHNWTCDETLALWCEHGNAQQFLSLDLTMGRVDDEHRLYPWLRDNGVTDADLAWLADNAVTYDALGANYYPWSYTEKARRPDRSVYSPPRTTTHGGTIAIVLQAMYERYGLPILITETSSKDVVAERGLWMDQTIAAVRELRAQGIPVVGYTWFPLFTMIEWEYRPVMTPLAQHLLHLGLYDCAFDEQGVLQRHPTRLVERFRRHMAEPMPALGSQVSVRESPSAAAAPRPRPALAT